MSRVANNLTGLIGKTPLMKLNGIVAKTALALAARKIIASQTVAAFSNVHN